MAPGTTLPEAQGEVESQGKRNIRDDRYEDNELLSTKRCSWCPCCVSIRSRREYPWNSVRAPVLAPFSNEGTSQKIMVQEKVGEI